MKIKQNKKRNKDKPKMREKIAMAVFMESVPSLIALWQEKCPQKTFDAWLMEVYEEHKAKSKKP